MTRAPTWIAENVGVYFRNATAVRDYRVQLRGSRAVVLWAIYLLILIGFGMVTYSSAAESNQMSVVEAQGRLQDFYHSVLMLLTTMVMLIAPALTATAIVAERQRKSLDLVFSAPVSPKYYLVGKMISSYRYILMLLVLSIPVTAACVVLGGASWSEVLVSYLLMSLHGLIYTAIALLFSTLAQRPAGAVVWSYIGVGGYVMVMEILASTFMIGPAMMYGGRGGLFGEAPFIVAMMPYQIVQTASTFSILFGTHVPNWILAIGFTLLVCKLMLLGAASVLSPYNSAETKSLRVHGLVYLFLVTLGFAAAMGAAMGVVAPAISAGLSGSGMGKAMPVDYDLPFGRLLVGITMPLNIVLPFITCFGVDLEKKFWPDGVFNPRRILKGTPSGGLAYSLTLVLAATGGIVVYALFAQPRILSLRFGVYVFFDLALVFAAWSVGRLTSSFNNGLRYARTMQFTFLTLATALPVPFLAMSDPFGYNSSDISLWDMYVLRPLFSIGDKSVLAALYGVVLIGIGVGITFASQSLAKSKYARMGMNYERA